MSWNDIVNCLHMDKKSKIYWVHVEERNLFGNLESSFYDRRLLIENWIQWFHFWKKTELLKTSREEFFFEFSFRKQVG